MNLRDQAALISRFKKERFLRQMSEDEFRDGVVRPLFLLMGMKDGRDTCGPREAGKDMILITQNQLGIVDIYGVQTKKANLNLGKKQSENVTEVTTQLRTALETPITFLPSKEKKYLTRVILAASGKISPGAKEYICENLKNKNIIFMDVEDLIPKIDEVMPELWCDIDANLLPYLRALKRSIEKDTQLFTRGELFSAGLPPVASSDTFFVSLTAFRYIIRQKTVRGSTQQKPAIEEFPVTGFISRKEPLILLLGEAGSGKSTALLRMVYMLCERAQSAEGSSPIPIFLRAEEISRNGGVPLLDLCVSRAKELSGVTTSPIKTQDLEQGLLFIFVDALDEIAELESQKDIISRIITFSKTYPKCRVIISSRYFTHVDKIPSLELFSQFKLSPISYKQAERILVRLRKRESLPVSQAAEFLRRMQDVHGLELNPLIVTVFAASSEYARRDIPANITELFKKFTEMMLGRWDADKGLALQYHAPLKDFLLTQIAYRIHYRKETSISVDEFKNLIADELKKRGHEADIEILTDEVINRSGLFRMVGDKVEFRHLMLQEFFAGRGLPSAETVYTLVTDDWWRRPLVFYFGDRPNEAQLLHSLVGKMVGMHPPALYQSAVTIGLAIQASYLLEVDARLPLCEWVMTELANVFGDYETKVVSSSRFPLRNFLNYYLFARDAVAFSILKDYREDMRQRVMDTASGDKRLSDIRHFWLIVGLIESGDLEGAEQELRLFAPKDRRFYLGLHLGALLIQHIRVITHAERETAKRICDSVAGHLPDLRQQLLDEFKSELLEIHKSKLEALEAPLEN